VTGILIIIIIAVFEALNYNISEFIINRTSINRCREQLREAYASNLKNEFENTNFDGLTVHWNGKLLPALISKENVDRLPIVITCSETEKLLGVPKITSRSGHYHAQTKY